MSKVELRKDSEKRLKIKPGRKHRRDAKLQELEKQLEFAESRCGTLKQQLDYIKVLYGCGKMAKTNIQMAKEEGNGDSSNVNPITCCQSQNWSNSGKQGKCGDSPDVIDQALSRTNTTTTSSSKRLSQEKEEQPKWKGSSNQKGHLKLLKVKKKVSKKVKKRRKMDDASSSKFSNASSQTLSQIWQDPLVEIYKNSAAVESESGLEIVFNNKRIKPSELLDIQKQKMSIKTSASKELEKTVDESKAKSMSLINLKKDMKVVREEGIQTELNIGTNPPNQDNPRQSDCNFIPYKENCSRTEHIILEPLKSYCQPTISSKKKQVERDIYSNLNHINVRNIPFIAARSTAPSHNIGINIQQVLSIIKKRQLCNEYLSNDLGSTDNPLNGIFGNEKVLNRIKETERMSELSTGVPGSSESKKRADGQIRTSMSHWKSPPTPTKDKFASSREKLHDENSNHDWTLKVNKLKNVLVFLHEDFSSLSQKYKRLQKKLTKRNISKTDAKGELAEIERSLEKKEEEIMVVIGLYKEVLNLREDMKKLQEKYNLITSGRTLILDGLRQSNSTHTQMTTLLRKIQNFQGQLKG